MQQQNITISALVDMYKRGELRLPEIQRHYVWKGTRVRGLALLPSNSHTQKVLPQCLRGVR